MEGILGHRAMRLRFLDMEPDEIFANAKKGDRRCREFVELAHRTGLSVQVWTVDTEADARRLLEWGVDALITDRPDLVVPVAKRGAGA